MVGPDAYGNILMKTQYFNKWNSLCALNSTRKNLVRRGILILVMHAPQMHTWHLARLPKRGKGNPNKLCFMIAETREWLLMSMLFCVIFTILRVYWIIFLQTTTCIQYYPTWLKASLRTLYRQSILMSTIYLVICEQKWQKVIFQKDIDFALL